MARVGYHQVLYQGRVTSTQGLGRAGAMPWGGGRVGPATEQQHGGLGGRHGCKTPRAPCRVAILGTWLGSRWLHRGQSWRRVGPQKRLGVACLRRHTTDRCMPMATRPALLPPSALPKPSKPSKRPWLAAAMAAGKPEAKAGTYKGVRTLRSSKARVSVMRSGTPVLGCCTPTGFGRLCRSVAHWLRRAGYWRRTQWFLLAGGEHGVERGLAVGRGTGRQHHVGRGDAHLAPCAALGRGTGAGIRVRRGCHTKRPPDSTGVRPSVGARLQSLAWPRWW